MKSPLARVVALTSGVAVAAVGVLALMPSAALMTAAGPAMAQPTRCSEALQFDTTVLQRNVAAQLSVLNTVNSSNYDQMKNSLGGSFLDLFSGNFNQFSEKRSQIQSSFSQEQRTEISENLYQRVLSPEGAKAYALCMRIHDPLVAWVSSSGISSNRVAVTVRNNLPGTGTIAYTVSGATPLNPPEPLTAGSEQTLVFNAPRGSEFFLVLNARTSQNNASLTVPPIELPAYVEYRREPEYRDISASGFCSAGCQGSTSGCQAPRSATLAAPTGFVFQTETLHQSARTTVGGPGIAIDPPWSWSRTPNSSPVVMTGVPGQCDGASPHSQGTVEYQFTARAVHYRTIKVQ
jgi:hypothetical protein